MAEFLYVLLVSASEFVVLAVLTLAQQFFGWMFKDFGDTQWGAAIANQLGVGPSPVSGDEYCLTFYCSRCSGKSEGKRHRGIWYLYQCPDCGHQWAVYQHDYRIKRDLRSFTAKEPPKSLAIESERW